jgi:poly(A) polymerase Pap1
MDEPAKKPRQLGISPPISEALPDARDLALDAELRRTLNSLGVFESAPQRAAR